MSNQIYIYWEKDGITVEAGMLILPIGSHERLSACVGKERLLSKVTAVPKRGEVFPPQTLTSISVTLRQPLPEGAKGLVKPHDKWAYVVLEGLSEIKENRAGITIINLSNKRVVLGSDSMCELEISKIADNGILGATIPARTGERTQNLIMQARKLCPPEYLPVFINIVDNYSDVIEDEPSGRIDQFPLSIETGQVEPIRSRPYKVTIHFQGEIDREISKLRDQRIIEKSESPWASPIVVVRKKNGSVEFLGHMIIPEGIQPCPSKVAAIRDFPRPRNLKKIITQGDIHVALTSHSEQQNHVLDSQLVRRQMYKKF
ncbi:uncharacterized protein [Palaemon carinicauda]|uniref:uncharacterized protein n=1 Tax=Palaemon carinicauda TaxID=392227 RepID=UPI0035B5D6DF